MEVEIVRQNPAIASQEENSLKKFRHASLEESAIIADMFPFWPHFRAKFQKFSESIPTRNFQCFQLIMLFKL